MPTIPRLALLLREHRETLATTVGLQTVRPDALVFATRSGRPLSRRNAHRAIAGAAKRVGLGTVGTHDLRRSFLSQAVGGGMSVLAAQPLTRHGSPATTARYLGDEQTVDTLTARLVAAPVGG